MTPTLKYALRDKLKYENIKQIIARASAKKRMGFIPKSLSWNGVTYLIDEKNRFPSGLLPLALEVIKSQGLEYQILEDYDHVQPFPIDLKTELNPWPHQRDAIEAIKKNITGIVQIGTGGGKAISITSKVLTTNGFKQMSEITLEDEVITPTGKSKVIGIYPQGVQDIYEVIFSDGSKTETTLDHLWAVRSAKDKYNGKNFAIRSLNEIVKIGLTRKNDPRSSQHFIPITAPIKDFNSIELPLNPYLLGVLLGDGSLHGKHFVNFTTIDEEIVENVKNTIPFGMKVTHYKNSISYGISNIKRGKNAIVEYLRLANLNVLSIHKFIPDEYKFSSYENRLALLQGLLDTDGGVESGRKISFSSSSFKLAKDVQFLVQSLGGIASLASRKTKCNDSYRLVISFGNDIKPFRLLRKINSLRARVKYFPTRSIKSVNYIGKKEAQCIKIEDERGLFLVDDCIVTHNTKLSVVACSEIGQFPFLFVVNRISLLDQTHADFIKYFGEDIGYIGNGRVEVAKINIASIGTLCSMLKIKHAADDDEEKLNYTVEQINAAKQLMAECRFAIIDECHHAAAGTYKTLMKALPKAFYRIGLSATPFRTDESENILLDAAFGKIIYRKTASDLILDGILAKPKIYMVQYKDPEMTRKYPKKLKKGEKAAAFTKIYKECVVENLWFNEIVCKCALTNAKMGRLTLISVKQVAHGKLIYDMMKQMNSKMPIEFLHGKNKKELNEEKVKQDFADGKVKILISTLFDEGVDIPKIDAVVDAGGGRSAIKALQLTGRAMRKYEGKTKAFIFMFIQPYTHLYKHSKARAQILQTEPEFDVRLMEWQE